MIVIIGNIYQHVSQAAAKIQAAYRRHRVLTWIHNDDDDDDDIEQDKGEVVSSTMDQLLGLSPEIEVRQLGGKVSEAGGGGPVSFQAPDSADVIRAMQIEIKRLQRMVARRGPPIPVDFSP